MTSRRPDPDPRDAALDAALDGPPLDGPRLDGSALERVHGPDEFLQAVPYLLGFHPTDSLVLVGLDGKIVIVTARLDLADAMEPGVLEHTLDAVVRGGATDLIAAVYDRPEGPPSPERRALVDDLVAVANGVALAVRDVLHVVGQRWWSYQCESSVCCPADGRVLDTAVSSFAAAATVAGQVVLPDREALEALLEPVGEAERDRLGPALAAAEHEGVTAVLQDRLASYQRSFTRALNARARESEQPGWSGLGEAEVARFGAGLAVLDLRDAAWLAIEGRRIDGRPLWRELARRLPSPYDAAPLFLYGWASWRAGSGANAGIAAERAIASDPHYSAADLLLAALSNGVDPRRMPRLRVPRARPVRGRRRAA